MGIITAICPHVGYQKAADIAKRAMKSGDSVRELILYFGAVMSVTKKFKLTTGEVNTDIDIMGDEAGNALCDWDGGLIMMDKEATV